MVMYPGLSALNIMNLGSPYSAILAAVIFNALIIPLLIPLALTGVKFRPMPAGQLFTYNLVIFGLGGVIAPFIGIKLIDMLISGVFPV
jgi:K+-transporting ATPase ATPase B chain